MNANEPQATLFIIDAEPTTNYTLEVMAQLTGIDESAIVHYQQIGIVRRTLNDEALRELRRSEHLRERFGLNLSGLKLITSLLDEVEQLRAQLRASYRSHEP